MKALKSLFAIPLLAVLLAAFSFTEKTTIAQNETILPEQNQNLVIGEIHWEGNTKYSDAYLNKIMELKPGNTYKKGMVQNLLKYDPDKTTISDLYMDTGHLYFNVEMSEEVIDDKANLNFKVYEGQTVLVDKIIIKGNKKVETVAILKMMDIKKDELFNRSKLISSQQNLSKSGLFVADSINIQPIPHSDFKLADFEFTVIEL